MKRLIASLSLVPLWLTLAAVPGLAQNIYDNGPVNGQDFGWLINSGLGASDSFTVSNGNGNVGGMDFWAWIIPGDIITSVEVQIGNQPLGNNLLDTTVDLTASDCFISSFGFDVCQESSTFPGPNLSNGTYWMTLTNAHVPSGDPAYWDVNSGVGCQSLGCPSQAFGNGGGTIPSESFTITAQGATTGTTPEPSSLVLLVSGFLGVVGVLQRKLR